MPTGKSVVKLTTLYKIAHDDWTVDDSPLQIQTAQAKPSKRGWKILTGREFFHFATYVRTAWVDTTLRAAIQRKRRLLKETISIAERDRKRAIADLVELKVLEAKHGIQ